MNNDFRIERLTPDTELLQQLAELHGRCLPLTLTSSRGPITIEGLYRRLLRRNHVIYAASRDNEIIGGVVITKSDVQVPSTYLFLYRPWSWILALGRLGPALFFRQIADVATLRTRTRRLRPHDYIVALYVSEQNRRLGVATDLLRRCASDASSANVGITVDTAINNESALRLYKEAGFVEFSRTRFSVLLTRSPD